MSEIRPEKVGAVFAALAGLVPDLLEGGTDWSRGDTTVDALRAGVITPEEFDAGLGLAGEAWDVALTKWRKQLVTLAFHHRGAPNCRTPDIQRLILDRGITPDR